MTSRRGTSYGAFAEFLAEARADDHSFGAAWRRVLRILLVQAKKLPLWTALAEFCTQHVTVTDFLVGEAGVRYWVNWECHFNAFVDEVRNFPAYAARLSPPPRGRRVGYGEKMVHRFLPPGDARNLFVTFDPRTSIEPGADGRLPLHVYAAKLTLLHKDLVFNICGPNLGSWALWADFVYACRNMAVHGSVLPTLGPQGCLPWTRRKEIRDVCTELRTSNTSARKFAECVEAILNFFEQPLDQCCSACATPCLATTTHKSVAPGVAALVHIDRTLAGPLLKFQKVWYPRLTQTLFIAAQRGVRVERQLEQVIPNVRSKARAPPQKRYACARYGRRAWVVSLLLILIPVACVFVGYQAYQHCDFGYRYLACRLP